MAFLLHQDSTLLAIMCLTIPAFCGKCSDRVNLALYKPATQSSTYDWFTPADRAVDGITASNSTLVKCTTCACTLQENKPWWMVDLGEEFFVQEVVLYNRFGAPERLRDFKIEIARSRVGNSLVNPELCAEKIGSQTHWPDNSYPCTSGGILGRYVRVTIQVTEYLTLCEVMVYGRRNEPSSWNETVGCEEKFDLHRADSYPHNSIVYSTTTTKSRSSCGLLCLQTQNCASFTVTSIGRGSWDCRLFECVERYFDPAPGTSYFVKRIKVPVWT